MNGVPTVAVADLPADAPMLDVREADEWDAGHAPTAQHLPMSELVARIDELPDDDPLYVVCRSGNRSARVVAYLAAQGYPAVNVDGGMQAWSAQGRDVVADSRRTADRLAGTVVPPPGCPARAAGTCPTPPGGPSARAAGATSPRCSGWPNHPRRPSLRPHCRGPAATSAPRTTPSRSVGASRQRRGPAAAIDPPRPPVPPERRARSLAAVAGPLLWALAAVALLAAGAETWRYVLLLASREGALSADAVAASDALVLAAGTGTVLLGLAAGGFVVGWSLPAAAAAAAAQQTRCRRGRGGRSCWAGSCPGGTSRWPGPVLAEIEHGALDRAPDRRPQPSRLVGLWWLLWVAGGVLRPIVLVWSWRTGVQARADGVVLHARAGPARRGHGRRHRGARGPADGAAEPGPRAPQAAAARRRPDASQRQAASRSSRNPRMTKSGRRRGGAASAIPGRRRRSASSTAATSSRASGAPRQ